jgi:hypothetical protein
MGTIKGIGYGFKMIHMGKIRQNLPLVGGEKTTFHSKLGYFQGLCSFGGG